MAPRIAPSLPEPLETLIAQLQREMGISRTQYFAIAGAFLIGYEDAHRRDAAEIQRLSAKAAEADKRFERLERRVFGGRRMPSLDTRRPDSEGGAERP